MARAVEADACRLPDSPLAPPFLPFDPTSLAELEFRRPQADTPSVRAHRQRPPWWVAAASVALLGLGLGAASAQAAEPPMVGGCRVFPAFTGPATARSAGNQTAWNQDVSRAPIDPNSSDYVARITSLGGNQVVHPDFGGNGRYGIPYTTVPADQRRVQVNVTGYPERERLRAGPYPAHGAGRERLGPPRPRPPALPLRPVRDVRCPLRRRPRAALERGLDRPLRPSISQAPT